MGSCAAVQLSYQPENADNVSKLRYRSSSGLVAVADDRGRITPPPSRKLRQSSPTPRV